MVNRRDFLANAGMAILSAGFVTKAGAASLPEAVVMQDANTHSPLIPPNGQPYNPVVTLNGWTLPWRMKNGVKEFHLVAEPVVREIAPGMKANLWGYNGQSPGPTIEVVEGDRVRIFVTNKLPESTTIHWHGQRLPNGMDGVAGLTQPAIPTGKTFVYEFIAQRPGTFMYHPHADEMLQMAMGMMGFWVTHPKSQKHPLISQVDRDFCFLINSYDIDPGSYTPKTNTMLDFNLWTWNSRAFPGIDPLVVGLNDKVRIRMGNLTMTNHPIHIHGHEFMVTGSDGGAWPKSARVPEVTTDIAVGQMRQIEFVADAEGDWPLHCHKSHHTMNVMGHQVPNMLGVNQDKVAEKISNLIPDYMSMGEVGGEDMANMQMPLPENTLPMMTGTGPYGAIAMGGMFSVVKVRKGLTMHDYKDPGWYQAPKPTVAYEWTGEDSAMPAAAQADEVNATGVKAGATLNVRKEGGHMQH